MTTYAVRQDRYCFAVVMTDDEGHSSVVDTAQTRAAAEKKRARWIDREAKARAKSPKAEG